MAEDDFEVVETWVVKENCCTAGISELREVCMTFSGIIILGN